MSYKDLMWMSIIFLYCVNFFNIGVYIPLLIFPMICIILVKYKYNVLFIVTLMTLLGFSFFYSIFQYFYGLSSYGTILLYLIYPCTLYSLGYIVTNGELKKIYRYLLIIIVSFTSYGYFSVLKTLLTYGGMTAAVNEFGGQRLVIDLWGNNLISATGINTLLSFGLAMLPVAFLNDQKDSYSKNIRSIAFLCFLFSTYSIIQVGNRTGIIIIMLTFITTLTLVNKMNLKKFLKFVLGLITFFITKNFYDSNILGLKDEVKSSLLYARLQSADLSSDPRFNTWKITFRGMFHNPMGGKKTPIPLKYSHNLWLDVGYEGGVIPFLFLVILTLIAFLSLFKFCKLNTPVLLKGILISLFVASISTFMVEPVIQGWFTYFNIFCFILGMVQRISSEQIDESINL